MHGDYYVLWTPPIHEALKEEAAKSTPWAYQGIPSTLRWSSEDFALPCIIQELYEVVLKVFSTKAIHTIWRVINILISEGDEFLSCLK